MQTLVELLTFRRENLITPGIFYINIFAYLAVTLMGGDLMDQPASVLFTYGANQKAAILDGEYYRLLAAVFLHGSLFHLLFNLYALVFVGSVLEKWDQVGFLYYYIVCGIMASIVSVAFKGMGISIGASGAIFAMFGLLYILTRYNMLNMDTTIQQNIRSSLVFFIGINLFLGFSRPDIDNAAHLGGLLAGAAFGFLHVQTRSPMVTKLVAAGVTAGAFFALLFLGNLTYSGIEKELQHFRDSEKKALSLIGPESFDSVTGAQKEAVEKKLSQGIAIWSESRKRLQALQDVPPQFQDTVDRYLQYTKLRVKQFKAIRRAVQSGKNSDYKKASQISDELGSFMGIAPGSK